MANKRVFFVGAEKMRAGFSKIVEADPPLARNENFHLLLLNLAGQETNAQHLVLTLTMALVTEGGSGYPINLSRYIEVLTDDAETVASAKAILERVTSLRSRKEVGPRIIQP